MRPAAFAAVSVLLLGCFCSARSGAQDVSSLIRADRAHESPEWANISAHLPDLDGGSTAKLEIAGDILRARRYDADALRYYTAAIQHGGDPHVLTKKMGIACLEMQQPILARLFFHRSVKLDKKDAIAWNDLGAAEFTLQNNRSAISDYKRAVKLDKTSAVFHSNLALAYFELDDPQSARHELSRALQLDPDLLQRKSGSGYSAQILATTRYAEICFEMARIYATQGDITAMLDWLAKASERGYDVRANMDRDSILRPMLADARVQLILKNTKLLRAGTKGPANVPSLGESPR